jgi:hypothetical protein
MPSAQSWGWCCELKQNVTVQLEDSKEVKNAENQMSATPKETTTRRVTYPPVSSCVMAVLWV